MAELGPDYPSMQAIAAEYASGQIGYQVATRAILKAANAAALRAVLLVEAGGVFVWDAGNFQLEVAADPAEAVFVAPDGADGSTGAWVRKFNGALRPEWFGATGDGATDDRDALYNALFLANHLGLRLEGDGSARYAVNSNIDINTYNKGMFTFDLNGATVLLNNARIRLHVNNNIPFLTTTLAADAFRGDSYVTLTSTAGLASGDLLHLESPALLTTPGTVNNIQCYVISEIDGANVYLESPLVADITAAQVTATGMVGDIVATAFKLSTGVTICDGVFQSDKAHDYGVLVQNQDHFTFKGIILRNMRRFGYYAQYCGRDLVKDCVSYDHGYVSKDQGYANDPLAPEGLSYGYGFIHARNYSSQVIGCRGGRGWSTFDVSRGQTHILYQGNVIEKDSNAFSSHQGAWDVTIEGNTVLGGIPMTHLAAYLTIKGNRFVHALPGSALGMQVSVRAVITDNIFDNLGSRASPQSCVYCDQALTLAAGSLSAGLTPQFIFENNKVFGHFGGQLGWPGVEAIIRGNHFECRPGVNYGCDAPVYGNRITISKNLYRNAAENHFVIVDVDPGKVIRIIDNEFQGTLSGGQPSSIGFIGAGDTTEDIEITGNTTETLAWFITAAPNIRINRVMRNSGYSGLIIGAATNWVVNLVGNQAWSDPATTFGGVPAPYVNDNNTIIAP
jgi:hypothetical protein